MVSLLSKFLKPHRWKILLYGFLTLITSAATMLGPLIGARIIDNLVNNAGMDIFLRLCCFMLALNIVNVLIGYLSNQLYIKIQTISSFSLNSLVVEHIKKLPISYIQKKDVAYLTQRVNSDCSNLISFGIGTIINVIINVFILIFAAIIVIRYNFVIGIVLAFFVILYVLLYNVIKKPLYQRGLSQAEAQNEFFSSLNEQLSSVKFIKIHSSNNYFLSKLNLKFKSLMEKLLSFQRVSYLFSGLDSTISTIAQVVIYLLGGIYVIRGSMSIGSFTVLNSYFKSLLSTMRYFFTLGKAYQEAKISYDRINEILMETIDPSGTLRIDKLEQVEISDLSFSHDNNPILRDFTYTFSKGFLYCIVGENGTGKSTFVDILLGLHMGKYTGDILLNSRPLSDVELEDYRRHNIGLCEQSILLVNDTLEKNLALFSMSDDDEQASNKLNKLMAAVSFEDLVLRSERGIDCQIYDGLPNISGGEKQKVGIIRQFVQNPDMYIFDEPTSSLDSHSIARFIETVQSLKKDKIVLVISHDSMLINAADHIIQFKQFT